MMMRRSVGCHRGSDGFILPISLFYISGILMLSMTSLMQSMTDLKISMLTVTLQQAFQLAEGGLDAKLAELSNANPADDETTLDGSGPLGTFQVTVERLDPNRWRLHATGAARNLTRRLDLTVYKNSTPLPVLGALTFVGENNLGIHEKFFHSTYPESSTGVINGCDAANPSTCLPGAVATTQQGFDDFVMEIQEQEANLKYGYFGDRLIGAISDYTGTDQYSLQHLPQDPAKGELGYDLLKSLANFAQTEADDNGCYIDHLNDDSNTNDSGGNVVIDGNVQPPGRFGDAEHPKICFVDVPFERTTDGQYAEIDDGGDDGIEDVFFDNDFEGAGILVLRGEGELGTSSGFFGYEGIIISLGPTGEIDVDRRGTVDIRGTVLIATTDPQYTQDESGHSSGSPIWIKGELKLYGAGLIQYDSDAVARAQSLLAGWTPPVGDDEEESGASPVTTLMWQEP